MAARKQAEPADTKPDAPQDPPDAPEVTPEVPAADEPTPVREGRWETYEVVHDGDTYIVTRCIDSGEHEAVKVEADVELDEEDE